MTYGKKFHNYAGVIVTRAIRRSPCLGQKQMKNRLPKTRGALEFCRPRRFEFFKHGQSPINFGNDARMFGDWWQRDRDAPQAC